MVAAMEEVASKIDIFASATGNSVFNNVEYMEKMKNNAVIGNLGPFHNRLDVVGPKS